VHTAPPLPTKFYPYIPKGIENAILKALEKNPDARFQTVEEFGSALERPEDFVAVPFVAQAPPAIPFQAAPNPPPIPPSMPPPRQAPPPMASNAVTATYLGTAQLFSGPPTPPPPDPVAQPQTQTGFVPPVAPIPPQPLPMPFLLTPIGKAVAGGAILLLLLVAGWIALRPKPADSVASTAHSTLPPRTATPLEQQISTPVSVTTLSSPAVSIPKVNTFRPASTSVAAGQTVHLTWSVSGASEVTISPGIGVVKPEGSLDIPLSRTTEFTLVAKNEKGEAASSSTTVLVEAPSAKPNVPVVRPPDNPPAQPPPQQHVPPPSNPPPAAPATVPPVRMRPEIAFSAVPNAVQQGGSVILRWYLSNADSATISPAPGVLRQTSGEYRVTPAESTTYTLTATSKDGIAATATAFVQVIPAAAPPPAAPAQRAGAAISVYHDHGAAFAAQNRVPPVCWGQLIVNGNRLVYRVIGTSDGRRDDFDIALTQVQEAKPNRIPIRNLPTFHVTVGGQHFNFIPQGMSAVQAASMIEGAAQGR